jgi:hypothetical protein
VNGLTKREHIAALIMAGFAAEPTTGVVDEPPCHHPTTEAAAKRCAEVAVIWADALIAELNKETKS